MQQKISLKITYLVVTLFAIAMGYMESAVVVYLREIYYPDGFDFPLSIIDKKIGITEILREIATLIMLLMAGLIAGRTKTEKFGFFIYSFAIWDIFYYIFLKFLLDWPESLLTWDILFLIPVTWVGPVLGPIINSLTMILLAILISYFTNRSLLVKIHRIELLILILGSMILISAYIEGYLFYMLQKFSIIELFNIANIQILTKFGANYIPNHFSWWLYILGEGTILFTLYIFYVRNKKALK